MGTLIESAKFAVANKRRMEVVAAQSAAAKTLGAVLNRSVSILDVEPNKFGGHDTKIDGLDFTVSAKGTVSVSAPTLATTAITDLVSLGLALEKADL